MLHKAKTSLSPHKALEQAKVYFGPGGQDLVVVSQGKNSMRLRGKKGDVDIVAKRGFTTSLELKTWKNDEIVRQFIASLPRSQSWWQRWRRADADTAPQRPSQTV